MTNLELLTVLSLWSNQTLRDSARPEDYRATEGKQAGDFSDIVEQLKSDPTGTMQRILLSECGVEWSGNGRFSEEVDEECKRRFRIARAEMAITPIGLLFSQHKDLQVRFRAWAFQHDAEDCPMNVVAWLQGNGLINVEAAKEFLKTAPAASSTLGNEGSANE